MDNQFIANEGIIGRSGLSIVALQCGSIVRKFARNWLSIEVAMNIKPLSDHILIEPSKEEEKTKSGILLPDTAEKERPEQGRVIAVGPGRKTAGGKVVPVEVKPGDRVLFTKYGPNEIKVGDKEYLIAKEEDILAIIE